MFVSKEGAVDKLSMYLIVVKIMSSETFHHKTLSYVRQPIANNSESSRKLRHTQQLHKTMMKINRALVSSPRRNFSTSHISSFSVSSPHKKRLVLLLFPGYEILDAFGPLEFFSAVDRVVGSTLGYSVDVIGERKGLLEANGGPMFAFVNHNIDEYLEQKKKIDLLLVPGGQGTRKLTQDPIFLENLKKLCLESKTIATICTGSHLLAKTGLLDGKKATSNKFAFPLALQNGPKVDWQAHARWVKDGDIFTSSGVAAGMDMALKVIERDFGLEAAESLAHRLEYIWNKDPNNDPFEAKI